MAMAAQLSRGDQTTAFAPTMLINLAIANGEITALQFCLCQGRSYQPILFLMAEAEQLLFGKILPKDFKAVIRITRKTKCTRSALTEPEKDCGTRAAR